MSDSDTSCDIITAQPTCDKDDLESSVQLGGNVSELKSSVQLGNVLEADSAADSASDIDNDTSVDNHNDITYAEDEKDVKNDELSTIEKFFVKYSMIVWAFIIRFGTPKEKIDYKMKVFNWKNRYVHRFRIKLDFFPLFRKNWFWYILYLGFSFGICVFMIYAQYFMPSTDAGVPALMSCDAGLWGSNCGANGINCRPLVTNEGFPIRCPSFCYLKDDATWYVYGSDIYRADSKVCKAAMHMGKINKYWGGCTKVRYTGTQLSFNGTTRNGITSQSADFSFIKSYTFEDCDSQSFCTDFRFIAFLVIAILFAGLIMLQPSKRFFFFTLSIVGWWYVIFFSDNVPNYYFTADRFGIFLCFLAIIFLLYGWGAKKCLPDISKFPLEIFFFYLCPCFLLLHMNYFEYFLPPFSLAGGEAKSSSADTITVGTINYPQWASILTTVVLMGITIILAALQLYTIFKSGLLPHILGGYIIFGVCLCFFWGLLSEYYYIHLHHYIFGLLLFPLTMFNTRLSMISQGLLLGMFINGVARWGFAPILEYSNSQASSPPLPPPYLNISNTTNTTISMFWPETNITADDVYSIIMDEYEVYRGLYTSFTMDGLTPNNTYYFAVRTIVNGYQGYRTNYINATTNITI